METYKQYKNLLQSKNLPLYQLEEEIVPCLDFVTNHFQGQTSIKFMEIGLAFGANFVLFGNTLLKTIPQVCGIGVDMPTTKRWGSRSDSLAETLEMCEPKFDYNLIIGSSRHNKIVNKVKNNLSNQPLDLLFIDGDHSKIGCTEDFRLYSPFVRDGGLILFHDIKGQPHGSFYVWKFWKTLKSQYKHVEFSIQKEGNGIGILIK